MVLSAERQAKDGSEESRDLLRVARAGWLEATGGRAQATSRFTIAGCRVALRFATGDVIEKVVPALAHLTDEWGSGDEELTICIWDSASTGVTHPPVPAMALRGEPLPGGRSHGSRDIPIYFQQGENLVSLLDVDSATGYIWIKNALDLPSYESGAPCRHVLHWFLAGRGIQMVHAGAVARGDRGALIVGRGGNGKSTTALSCAADGFDYVSDDYSAITHRPSPFVHGLFNTGKLDPSHALRFPKLLPAAISGGDGEKSLSYLSRVTSMRTSAGCPINVVILPTVSGRGPCSLELRSPAAALAELAPSTIFQLPGAGAAALATMARTLESVPCWRLVVGEDPLEIPHLVEAALEMTS